MPASEIMDLSRLCLHTITTKPWAIETAIDRYARAGVKGITIWRDAVDGRSPAEVRRRIADQGLSVVSLCRGGFFPSTQATARQEAIEDNRRIIDLAAALGAPLIVLVCGADPGQELEESRKQILQGIEAVLPQAEKCGVRLAVEPLHPMYADSRSAINTMAQARKICRTIDSPWLGIAVDVYHIWWDPDLEKEIEAAGTEGRIFAFHICDWRTPTVDMLNDRGLMGEGCIPIRKIRGWVESAGFAGFHEVEIFSNRWWQADQDEFLKKIVAAYRQHS